MGSIVVLGGGGGVGRGAVVGLSMVEVLTVGVVT